MKSVCIISGRRKFLVCSLLCLVVTGCGRPLLRRFSSLRPRTAQLDYRQTLPTEQITFRSQDSRLSGYSGLLDSANDIEPNAKLQLPDLIRSQPLTAPAPTARDEKNSLNFTANDIRRRLNQQAEQDLKDVDLLPEQTERWNVIRRTAAENNSPNADSTASSSASNQQLGTAVSNATEVVDTPSITDASSVTDTPVIVPDRSFVERLKDLYESGNPRSFVRKNIRRIQAPFNAFLDKSESLPEPQTAATDIVVAPEINEFKPEPKTEAQTFDEALSGLIAETEDSLADWPRLDDGQPLDADRFRIRQQDLRILYLIANRDSDALRTAQFSTAEEQEFWQELMLAMTHFRKTRNSTDRQRFSQTVRQIRSAADRLTPLAQLEIRRAEFCARIHSFGRIDGFPSNDFNPGDPILIYAELANVASEFTFDGSHRTDFDASLAILHAGEDEPIETIELKDIVDESTSLRRDYFQSFELTIPAHLSTGSYEVKLQIRDTSSGQTVTKRLPFQVR